MCLRISRGFFLLSGKSTSRKASSSRFSLIFSCWVQLLKRCGGVFAASIYRAPDQLSTQSGECAYEYAHSVILCIAFFLQALLVKYVCALVCIRISWEFCLLFERNACFEESILQSNSFGCIWRELPLFLQYPVMLGWRVLWHLPLSCGLCSVFRERRVRPTKFASRHFSFLTFWARSHLYRVCFVGADSCDRRCMVSLVQLPVQDHSWIIHFRSQKTFTFYSIIFKTSINALVNLSVKGHSNNEADWFAVSWRGWVVFKITSNCGFPLHKAVFSENWIWA